MSIRTIVFSIFFLAFFFSIQNAHAVPPTSPYLPNETIAPGCAPGASNCIVRAPAESGANTTITSLEGLTTALSPESGGTGISHFSIGDILYAAGTDLLQSLEIGSEGQVLKVSDGLPVWGTDLTSESDPGSGSPTTFTAGSGIDAASLSSNIIAVKPSDFSLGSVGGTLNVSKGGTGLSSIASGTLLYGSGSSSLNTLAPGSEGKVLKIVSGAPAWATETTGGGGGQSFTAGTGINSTSLASNTIAVDESALTLSNLGGTLAISQGGTGATSASTALSNLLPSQTGNSGKVLTSDGSSASWVTPTHSGSSSWGSITGTLGDQTDLSSVLSGKEASISSGTTSQYWRGDKSWQTLNKSAVGLSNVENTALSTWIGSANVTTLGTITGGVWNGSTIPVSAGGTGATTRGGALSNLLPDATGQSGKFLTTDGSTFSWSTPSTGAGSIAWGAITGTLANQTDLVTALSAKEPTITSGTTSQYFRGDKTWQTLDKSSVGLSSVENTALSTWNGSTNITTLGTIGSGVWNGSAIPLSYGGTGASTAAGARTALLPTQTGNSGKYLTTDGTNVSWATASSAPAWGVITGTLSNQSDLSSALSGKEASISSGTTSQYFRGDKTWQTLDKSAVGLSSVENTALSTWNGSSALTTLGTITSGTWNGSAIPVSAGGTGATSASTALSNLLPSQTGNSGKVLTSDGSSASWVTPSNVSAAWGSITGTLANQTDLVTALGLKEPTITSGTTGQYWRGDKSWQTLDKSAVGLSNVENTALSTWAGSANITTLGTIGTGTWNGTTIGISKGGTGATSKTAAFDALSPLTTIGDILYGGASGTGTRLTGNTTTTKKFFTETGDGTNAQAPSWSTISSGDIPAVTLSSSGAGGVTGTLPIANGGTGATTLAGAGILAASCADVTGQTTANTSIKSLTAPNDGTSHTYSLSGYVTVTAISVNVITAQVTFTDQNNTSRTLSLFGPGLSVAGISTTGFFPLADMTIRAKANTAVTMKTSVTGVGSQTYDAGACITQLN